MQSFGALLSQGSNFDGIFNGAFYMPLDLSTIKAIGVDLFRKFYDDGEVPNINVSR